MTLKVYLRTLQQKGNLAYEYNPFHNYQTDVKLYKYNNYIFPEDKAINPKNGEILIKKTEKNNEELIEKWIDKRGNIIDDVINKDTAGCEIFAEPGSLIDFDTDQLNFDLEHPVDIEIQPSYDGSVNLILNDDKNIPRLINSRFSVREKNTYEIVDRIGENDTNIYNSKTFDKDTSLYFQYEYNPIINYLGFVKGNLPVGSYCFYFTYCDADNNESDYITESGIIPVFIGNDKEPSSIDGGIKNQNSNKGIRLKLSNLDKSYNYLKVTYVRYFADYQQNRVYECKKIYKRYFINSSTLYIQITGDEETEDLDANILNISRFNPKSVLTQAQCKNMLFFGNIVKNSDNYRELSDCALRIIPQLVSETLKGIDIDYQNVNQDTGYYNSLNMYNKVGYHNKEYYRFGVVFVYENGTLSNVYNTLGGDIHQEDNLTLKNDHLFDFDEYVQTRNYIKVDDNGWVDSSYIKSGYNVNAKGVCKIDYLNTYDDDTILGIKFNIPIEVTKFLKEDLGIRGMFFVRQKCIPNILAQCYILPMDEQLKAPVIKNGKNYYTECFVTQPINKNLESGGLFVSQEYNQRLYKYGDYSEDGVNKISEYAYAAICPDFLLNQPYYNQIFNGAKFRLEEIKSTNLVRNGRFYTEYDSDYKSESNIVNNVIINTVTEDVPTIAIKNKTFKLEIGKCEEAYRFEYAEIDRGTYNAGDSSSENVNKATNIVRGKYSPYLAIYSSQKLSHNSLYNIYSGLSANTTQEYQNRMDSSDPFYAISDRYNFDNLTTFENSENSKISKILICWRGDCFLNQFTYRLNRNFNDPSLPNNDKIIDRDTWKEHYKSTNPEEWKNISRSDINAVQLGSWITIKVRSFFNYALRSVDHSYVSEEALMGSPRSFYPRSNLLQRGENKIPDSYLYNDAFRATLGFKCYFTLQDMNYIKNTFSNRIQYSAVAIQDSFKNNYRESLSTYFRDYSQEYGSIQKLIGFEGYLLVIFEHAIGIATINERILAANEEGGPVFINSQNVLPEELNIISDTYGTQWGESVIKSEAGYVYGVDTVAKKIWRIKGQQLEILSDFKVNEFLVDNISLGERELYPIVGLKNVKTHYNNNKKDIMFTFYDNIYKDEEKVWNLCYNELLGQFVTFYTWVPSYSENIDNQFFTFDRNTSKWLSLLYYSNYNIPENDGVLVDHPILKPNEFEFKLYYVCKDKTKSINYTVLNEDGTIATRTVNLEGTKEGNQYILQDVHFRVEKDHWHNYELVSNNPNNSGDITLNISNENFENKKVLIFYITPYIENPDWLDNITATTNIIDFKSETIAVTLDNVINEKLTTDFYLHGQAGIFDVAEDLYPTHWYGEYHPFEFEFVVNDKIAQQKIFSNLVIISNKAEPESFHFEIEGDNYEFSQDKRTMYYRQEKTKKLYQDNGSDILYNRYYTDVKADKLTREQYYRPYSNDNYNYLKLDKVYPIYQKNLVQQKKSTIFPLYYERIDKYNDIYHSYELMKSNGIYDLSNLSGSEISWNRKLNQFNIMTHIKNNPIDLVGRIRGNSRYKEGKWNVQIPSITFMQKNEEEWSNNEPPIIINSQQLPKDISNITEINVENIIPNIISRTKNYKDINHYINVNDNGWTSRKETKIRDKWIKIRVRYSGENLAVIHSLITLYNISYS